MTKKIDQNLQLSFFMIQVSQYEQENHLRLNKNETRLSSFLSVVFSIQLSWQHPASLDNYTKQSLPLHPVLRSVMGKADAAWHILYCQLMPCNEIILSL